jgi:hypothetical protein
MGRRQSYREVKLHIIYTIIMNKTAKIIYINILSDAIMAEPML